MQQIEIQMLSSHAHANIVDMKHVTSIINRVYAASEEGLWTHGADRTTVEEIVELTTRGEIAVARLKGNIVGCVRVQQLDEETGELGMLAVDDDHQGTGIGRELIRFAEQKCQKEHLRKMQLELLVPQEGSHPAKATLENWYTRIGYQPIRTMSFDDSFPRLAKLLAIPCKLIVFQKDISLQVRGSS